MKLVYCVRRASGMSEEDFHHYWRKVHGALAEECLPIMGASKYVQSHTISTPLNDLIKEMKGLSEGFDGIAEIWWDDMDSLLKAMDSEKWQETQDRLFNDESKFIDLAHSCSFFCSEEQLV